MAPRYCRTDAQTHLRDAHAGGVTNLCDRLPAMGSTVIVAGARTPMGRLSGALGTVPATELGGTAIRGALRRAHVDPVDVEYVIMGQVLHGRLRADSRPAGRGRRRDRAWTCRR